MKSLCVLALIVVMSVLAACGETSSPSASATPDLEATVEARVQATIEAPTPTPELEATVTASVQATRAVQQTVTPTSVPTQTPIPRATSTPAPTRTPRPTATPDASPYYKLGRDSIDKGEYDNAISHFTTAIRLNPNNALYYANRGAAYFSKGDYDGAILNFDKAIELNPDYANAYLGRGGSYTLKGDYDMAIADIERVFELEPGNSGAKELLAEAYVRRSSVYALEEKDYDSAIADVDRAIELVPNNPDLRDFRDSISHLSTSSLIPSSTSAPEGHSREKPTSFNRSLPIQGNDVSLSVVDVIEDATSEVLNHSWLNHAPPAGFQYLIVNIEVHNDSDSVVDPFFLTNLGLIGNANVAYSQLDFGNMCGLEIPDSINYMTSIFPGGKLTGNICFSVQSSEVDSLVMYHRDPWGLNDNILYWALR